MAGASGQTIPPCETCGAQLVLGNLFCETCSQMWGAPEGVRAADYGTRAVAYILDTLISWAWVMLLVAVATMSVLAATRSFSAIPALAILVLWLGLLVWWVLLLRRSQTPGKLIMKLWVACDSAQPAGWGLMVVREVLVKSLLFGLVGGATFDIGILVDLLWPLWDRNKQTLHDKIAGTDVMRRPRQGRESAAPCKPRVNIAATAFVVR